MALALKVIGLNALRRKNGQRRARLNNLRGANLAAAEEARSLTLRNMGAEVGLHEDATLRWPPLAASTRKQRARIGKWPGPMLQVNGRLIGSFEASATARSGKVVNRTPYAAFHEDGTKKMPQRKMFPTLEHLRRIVEPVYALFVRKAIR